MDNISKLKCPSILTNGFLESPLEQKVFQFWNAMDQFEESEALNTSK